MSRAGPVGLQPGPFVLEPDPFVLSLSKHCSSYSGTEEGQGFYKLSPNGEASHA